MADGRRVDGSRPPSTVNHPPFSQAPSAMIPVFSQTLRTLGKSPGFSALVVAVLAIGIGANTAIFSIVNGVVLRPLPFTDASRLVSVDATIRNQPDDLSYPDFLDLHAH